jgi:hypothetical protein
VQGNDVARRELTDRTCQTAKATKGQAQTDFWDGDADSKGLVLRVSRSGAKTWNFIFVSPDNPKRLRMKLGTYPATTLAKARGLAKNARADLEAGRDPRAAFAKAETLRSICEEYLSREAGGLRSGKERRATLANRVYPFSPDGVRQLRGYPINDVKRSDVVRLLDHIEDERGPAMADKVLAFVRRVFNWHASRSDDFRSPIVRGMARTKPRERSRKRILTDDEIRVVWRVAAEAGAFGRLVRFLLLTGARRTEAAAMPWSELSDADWLLPAPRNKAKLDLLRPLPKAALAVLGPKPDGAVYVFSTDGGATSLSGFSKAKAEFDRAVLAELRKTNANAEPLPNWTLHDLRRTARSLMSRAKVSADHAERVLGHVIGGIRETYDRYEYLHEKRQALAALAGLIDRIISDRPTVLKLVRRKANATA